MKSIRIAPLALIVLTMAACGSDKAATTDSASTSSLVDIATSTSAPADVTSTTTPVTTAASTTTSTSTTSTSPTTSTTTTTLSPGAELVLRENGLGSAAFGADPDGVVAYVSSIIGPLTVDTGWVNPLSVGACPGTEMRQVSWSDLTLDFSDQSNVTSGRRHFFSYVYGPKFGAAIAPAGLKTDAGIGVGSTVAELTGTYPSAVVGDDPIGGPNFSISDGGLTGFLTGVTPTDTVISVLGGIGCGE